MQKDETRGLGAATVLTLDDDPAMRTAVGSALRAAGCGNVIQVSNGPDALDIVANRHVDLLLCDCQMLPMDGLTFLSRLRITRAGARMPVIMLTASSDEKDAWLARELDAAAWLVKPVRPGTLVAHVAAALGMPAPDIQPDCLATLADAYEKRLPDEIARLVNLAKALEAGRVGADEGIEELVRGLHTVRGQAGTLGYPLLGEIAGWLHDLLRRVVRHPEPTAPLLAETVRVVQIGAGALSLVAARKLRGQGGAAGVRIVTELGGVVAALAERLDAAIRDSEKTRHESRSRGADRRAEIASNQWLLARRINLDPPRR